MNAYDAEGTGQIRMTLHSGHTRIDVRTIAPDEIRIHDIAHALANICRFTGHVPVFYSVAQHSLIVAELVPPALQLQALLHDATEAYLNDLSHFLKHAPELAGYRALEADLEAKIMRRFGLPLTLDPVVKDVDRGVTEIEWQQMMAGKPVSFFETIVPMTPPIARQHFLNKYAQLTR